MLPLKPEQFVLEERADASRVVCEAFLLDDLKHLERHGTAERCATVGCTVGPGSEQFRVFLAYPKGSDRKAAPEGLGHGEPVWFKGFCALDSFESALEALESSGPEMTALDAVDQEQEAFFVAESPQAQEIFRGGWRDAALSLNSFDQNRHGCWRKGFPYGCQIVVGHVTEPRDHRFKSLLNLFLSGCGDAAQGSSVEGVEGRDDFETSFGVPEFAGQLIKAFVRLRSTIAEENAALTEMAHYFLGEPSLRFVIVEIGDVYQALRLLDECLGDTWMRVSKGAHCDAAAHVEIPSTVHIEQPAALPAMED